MQTIESIHAVMPAISFAAGKIGKAKRPKIDPFQSINSMDTVLLIPLRANPII